MVDEELTQLFSIDVSGMSQTKREVLYELTARGKSPSRAKRGLETLLGDGSDSGAQKMVIDEVDDMCRNIDGLNIEHNVKFTESVLEVGGLWYE